MFQAIVVACFIADPTVCVEFHNTRHPINTPQQCESRAMEMARDINEMTHEFMAKQWRCYPLKKGQLT